jgi:hypothetical protein
MWRERQLAIKSDPVFSQLLSQVTKIAFYHSKNKQIQLFILFTSLQEATCCFKILSQPKVTDNRIFMLTLTQATYKKQTEIVRNLVRMVLFLKHPR